MYFQLQLMKFHSCCWIWKVYHILRHYVNCMKISSKTQSFSSIFEKLLMHKEQCTTCVQEKTEFGCPFWTHHKIRGQNYKNNLPEFLSANEDLSDGIFIIRIGYMVKHRYETSILHKKIERKMVQKTNRTKYEYDLVTK